MTNRNRRMLLSLLFLFLSICMSACGQKETSSGGSDSETDKKLYDLSSKKWREYEEISGDDELWTATGYWEYLEPEMLDGTTYLRECSASDEQNYYVLYSHTAYEDRAPADRTYYLTRFDPYNLEEETVELGLSEGEGASETAVSGLPELAAAMESCQARVKSMDVIDGKLCLYVVWRDRESDSGPRIYAVYLDSGLRAERIAELTAGLQQAGVLDDAASSGGIRCGGEGNLYIGISQITVLDGEGRFLKTLECPGSSGSAVMCTGRLPDGQLLFEASDSESGDTVIFCLEDGKEKVLYKGQSRSVQLRHINPYGQVFSLLGGEVLLWDAAEGSGRRLYMDTSLMKYICETVLEAPDGGVILIYYDWEGFYCTKLQREADTEEKVVSIQATWGMVPQLKKAAAEYSRKHPGTRIELILPKDEDKGEITLNRIMAQISMGEGPDMLLLHRDEMLALQDEGALADLTGLLPKELLDQVFPGVLQYGGTDDGRLWAVICEARVTTLVVSEELWPEDTWTYRDVMGLVEEREAAGEPVAWLSGQDMTPDDLLYFLAIMDVEAGGSSLVDREEKQCYFDTEEFVQLLEFCRKHGKARPPFETISEEEQAAQVHEGSALAYHLYGDLQGFSRAMTALGDGYKCIGFPSDSSSGSYVSCYDCLAVTAAAAQQEAACDFLLYLMSEKVQRTTMNVTSVRKDVLSAYVVEDPGSSEEPRFQFMKGGIIPLTGRPDGSSFLPEYMEIMENGVMAPNASHQIRNIVSEEAAAYFAGDKSAMEAAEIIQSRVWLYLNE